VIGQRVIQERVREWQLGEQVVEKDYVLGWVLWGIGSDPTLSSAWVFKGGTCLKKCYIETYRFSEDLDFSVMPGGPVRPADVAPLVALVLERVAEESGIQFEVQRSRFQATGGGHSTQGRIYYRGPRQTREAASIKLDLTGDERVVRPSVLRPIAHPYPDALPAPGQVRCYAFDELFAEKIRAMGERCRPRDLFDIVNLFWRSDLRAYPELIRAALVEKCQAKGVDVPTYATLASSPYRAELESPRRQLEFHRGDN
jgi:predicted nucleotidyltransferase component of viral defense system